MKKYIDDYFGLYIVVCFQEKLDEAKKEFPQLKGGFTDKLAKDFMKNWKITKDMIKKIKKKYIYQIIFRSNKNS